MIGQEYHAIGITEVPEYTNLSAGIVTALMSGTIVDYKVITLYQSSDIEKYQDCIRVLHHLTKYQVLRNNCKLSL